MLDELVELMVDTVCSRRETIRIAGDDYPAEVVKSRFLKLNSSHIEYVLDRMRGEHHLRPQHQKNICWLPCITPRPPSTATMRPW